MVLRWTAMASGAIEQSLLDSGEVQSLQKNIVFPTKFPTKNLEKFVGKRISNEFSNKKIFVGNSSSEIFPTKNFNFCCKFAMTFFSLDNSLKNS